MSPAGDGMTLGGDGGARGGSEIGARAGALESGDRSAPEAWEVGVVGAGSWGTALAVHAAHAGHHVRLWVHDPAKLEMMLAERENPTYLPGTRIPDTVTLGAVSEEVIADADLVISVVPSRFLRSVWQRIGDAMPPLAHLVSATKGIEQETGLRMSEVLLECVATQPTSIGALSGPSFARELVEGHPTAVTLGCRDLEAAAKVQAALSYGPLRVYRTTDIVGVELGGALKNVIALAAGIVDGLGLGTNTRAALISRGLKEMAALAGALGADPSTLTGLAGLGDLVLTCTGPLSRNRQVGVEVGRGRRLEEVTAGMEMVAEGVVTVRSAQQIAAREGVEMPITEQVFAVLYEGRDPRAAIEELLARALVEE